MAKQYPQNSPALGAQIQQARLKRKLPLATCASQAGMEARTLRRIERGHRVLFRSLRTIIDFLGLPFDYKAYGLSSAKEQEEKTGSSKKKDNTIFDTPRPQAPLIREGDTFTLNSDRTTRTILVKQVYPDRDSFLAQISEPNGKTRKAVLTWKSSSCGHLGEYKRVGKQAEAATV